MRVRVRVRGELEAHLRAKDPRDRSSELLLLAYIGLRLIRPELINRPIQREDEFTDSERSRGDIDDAPDASWLDKIVIGDSL